MVTLSGSCLCGAVRFGADGPVKRLNLCHCRMCQKAHGAAFAPYARVDKDKFYFTAGEEHVKTFVSSPDIVRTFCGTCGSNLQWIRESSDGLGIAAGCLDTRLDMQPAAQFYCQESQAWHRLRDDVDTFAQEYE